MDQSIIFSGFSVLEKKMSDYGKNVLVLQRSFLCPYFHGFYLSKGLHELDGKSQLRDPCSVSNQCSRHSIVLIQSIIMYIIDLCDGKLSVK